MDEQVKIQYGPGKVDKKNASGLKDPTAYEALSNIKKEEKLFLPLVYICSPYRGDTIKNAENARSYSRAAVDRGYIPLAPHLLLPQYLSDDIPEERELAMFMNMVFLGKCNELWVVGSRITEGMQKEIEKAKRHCKTIRYFSEDMKEVGACN